jgi:hypothetical protein
MVTIMILDLQDIMKHQVMINFHGALEHVIHQLEFLIMFLEIIVAILKIEDQQLILILT